MPNGYWNRILHVDLTAGRTWVESPGEEFFRLHLGGRSMIAHYLLAEVPPGADPLGPANVLVFAAGVLTGIPFPGAGRHSVGAKSPMTGAFGESESGGFWGAELKHAGWDGIVVHGQAEHPVYLWIKDDQVEIKDASHLWGKETDTVEDTLRAELGGDRLIRIAQTGIAGENGIKYALVVNDLNEVAGRTGMGAVMASKRLKAIAVRGSLKVPVADNTPFKDTSRWVIDTMEENHYAFHHFGTGGNILGKHLEGHLIVKNFQDGQWTPEQTQAIDANTIASDWREKMDGCWACSVRCKKRVRHEALGVVPKFGGPEYETIGAVGTNLTIDDLPDLMLINQRMNAVGVDSVSFGATIAWAMECYDRGILTDADTGGIPLRWGDSKTVLKVLELIARREGPLGELLADGALQAARKLGRDTEQYVVHVKGLEVAMHDPRGMPRMLENYPTNPTGGDHTGGSAHKTSLRNTVGVCIFLGYDEPRVVDLVNGATGWGVDEAELRTVVSRGLSMSRLFNLREGITTEDDRLPKRLHEPTRKGPLSTTRLEESTVRDVVTSYYVSQGWHEQSGLPRQSTLEALGIGNYATHAPQAVYADDRAPKLPPAVVGVAEAEERHAE
jgi:aldehyde:ferredoxin oxidoreductase